MKMLNYVILIILMLPFSHKSVSQTQSLPVSMVPNIPATPQAEALKRLGEYKADNPYGMPDISIPLYELDYFGYKIPFVLKYEAQPIHPGYNYDVYGRGWKMSGASCVSRTIRGLADEKRDFKIDTDYLTEYRTLPYNNSVFENSKNFNFRYDQFNAVLPSGRSFSFFIRKEGSGNLIYDIQGSDSDVKIQCEYTTSEITAFNITDEDGVKYNFTLPDKATNAWASVGESNVTWSLTSIEVPNVGNIYYSYGDLKSIYTYTTDEPVLNVRQVFPYSYDLENTTFTEDPYWFSVNQQQISSVYKMRFLKSITSDVFSFTLNYMSDGTHISSIEVKECGELVRKIDFSLRSGEYSLSSLTFKGSNDTDKLVYKFEYSPYSPGNKTDFWGNYCNNGRSSDIGNFTFYISNISGDLPQSGGLVASAVKVLEKGSTDIQSYHKLKAQYSSTGDSRQPDNPNNHCILRSIIYPNGGKTTFTFENHRFVSANRSDGGMEFDRRKQRILEGGGYRIKSILNYSSEGILVSQDEYRYGYTYGQIRASNFPLPNASNKQDWQHIGCGEPVVDPNLLTFLNYDMSSSSPSFFLNMITGITNGGISGSFENINVTQSYQNPWWYDFRLSAINFRNLLNSRNAVAYPEITVYHGDVGEYEQNKRGAIGKTVYKYDIFDTEFSAGYLNQFSNKGRPDTAYFEHIKYVDNMLVSDEHPARRAQLVSKTVYSNASTGNDVCYKEISREDYRYYNYETYVSTGYVYNNRYSLGHSIVHDLNASLGRPNFSLIEFYTGVTDIIGKSRLSQKDIKETRLAGSLANQIGTTETFSYRYGDNISVRTYWDNGQKQSLVKYPADIKDTSIVAQAMIAKNMLAIPILHDISSNSYMGQVPIEGTKINYADFGGKILPWIYCVKKGDNYEPLYQVNKYSRYGRPLEIKNRMTNVITSYIWGYIDRYLIAEIVNATREEVENALACVSGGIYTNGKLDMSKLNMLRNYLPNSEISTWTYTLGAGINLFTDKNGHVSGYEYDAMGRLVNEVVYDNNVINSSNRRITKSYSYEYKN